jgi:hypothetical protein
LLSGLLGENRDIFFPKLSDKLHLITFSGIAIQFLKEFGYEPYECSSEEEARYRSEELIVRKLWPCYFLKSDTTGEKDFEEFFTADEELDISRFHAVGIIKNKPVFSDDKLDGFLAGIKELRYQAAWTKNDISKLYYEMLPEFNHKETGKYLDQRM